MTYQIQNRRKIIALSCLVFFMTASGVFAETIDDALDAYDKNDYFTAYELFLQAAEEGNTKAQFEVGKLYYQGLGTRRNREEGLRWMEMAAESGNTDACNELGDLYLSGKGVDIDLDASTEWYRKAADQGDAEGMFNLGAAYFRGREGAPTDYYLSYVWMQLAARKGYREAAKYAKTIEIVLSPEDVERAKRFVEEKEMEFADSE